MSKEKTIHELELHEYFFRDGIRVTRVAGGWIYSREEPQVNALSACFVPYSSEFRESIKLDTPKYKEEVSHVIEDVREIIKNLKLNVGSVPIDSMEKIKQYETALEILRTHTI